MIHNDVAMRDGLPRAFRTNQNKTPDPFSSEERLLNLEATAVIWHWKFRPRLVNGKPVDTPDVCQTISFRIAQSPNNKT